MKLSLIVAQQNGGSSIWSMMILFIILFGAMYFFSIKPQKKRIAEQQEKLSRVKKGDHIITRSGLHGVVDSVNQDKKTFVLDASGIFLTFELGAIMQITENSSSQHLNTKDDTDIADSKENEEAKTDTELKIEEDQSDDKDQE